MVLVAALDRETAGGGGSIDGLWWVVRFGGGREREGERGKRGELGCGS